MQAQGWINDPAAVDAACVRMAASGHPVAFADARPNLAGYWPALVARGIYGVFAFLAERAILGEFQPANTQQRGTCGGQGTERALRDSILFDLWKGGEVGRPARIAFELIYAGARTLVRKGALGHSDGMVIADGAEFVRNYGTIERGVYGSIDLTKPREDLAVSWGAPHATIPQELLTAATAHKAIAHQAKDFASACDALAAGYTIAIGSDRIHSDTRDADGFCHYKQPGGHCTEFCGVFVMRSWDGKPETLLDHTGVVNQQSWGEYPRGNETLNFYNGSVPLRQGAFGLTASEVRAMYRSSGDAWAFKMESEYR